MLLERAEQLRACADYLAEAAAGHGRLVYVAGEAGIGKSTFTAQVMADAVVAFRSTGEARLKRPPAKKKVH